MKPTPLFLTILLALALLASAPLAFAGPITGGPGNAPFTKLGVYQGVFSVIPGGAGDSVLEIGNAGRDIASTGSLIVRPGGSATTSGATNYAEFFNDAGKASLRVPGRVCIGTTAATCVNLGGSGTTPTLDLVLQSGNDSTRSAAIGYLTVKPQNSTGEGGEIQLQGSGANPTWFADVFNDRLRFYSGGGEKVTITNAGNLGVNNFAPNSKIVVNVGAGDNGGVNDGIHSTVSAADPSAAVYGEQRGTGYYAGYFTHGASGRAGVGSGFVADATLYADNMYEAAGSTVVNANAGIFIGDLEVRQKNTSTFSGTWAAGDVLKVVADTGAPAPGGYPLHVINRAATGFAAGFSGSVSVSGQGKYGTGPSQGSLEVYNTGTNGGTAIYAQGGAGDGSTGIVGHARSVPAGQSSYGIYGGQPIGGSGTFICGDGSGGGNCYSIYGVAGNGNGNARTYGIYGKSGTIFNGISYAGYFEGPTAVTGDLYYKGRLKPMPGLQVCQIGSDTCLGQYLYTSGSARDTSGSGLRYNYDNGSSVQSVLVYVLNGSTPTCSVCGSNWQVVTRSVANTSYWSQAGCGGAEYVLAGQSPTGSGQTCRDNTTDYSANFYPQTGASCSGSVVANNTFKRVNNNCLTSANSYGAVYELR